MIAIKDESGAFLRFDEFWLRDHCLCAKECYNTETKQRRYNLLDIPENVKVEELLYLDNEIDIKWSDGHNSRYSLNFLQESQFTRLKNQDEELPCTTWNQSIILENKSQIHFSHIDLMRSEDDTVKSVVTSLVRYGLVFIEDVPPTTEITELAMRRLFPIMRTFFGDMYTFSDQPDHADTAYTKQYLGLHTDNTYFCDAAGLQALHCIEHVNVEGGENFFADGLAAVMELKATHPKAFDILSTVQVPAEYIEAGQHHKYSAPIIRVDPVTQRILQLRLNLYDRSVFNTIDQKNVKEFYASLRELVKIVQNQANQLFVKLCPGTIVIFDNWRILHGRKAYSGQRKMTGCYVQRTDFLSKARTLGIID